MSKSQILLIILLISSYLIIGFLFSFHEPYLASSCLTTGDKTICEQNKISKNEWIIAGIKIVPVWPLVLIGIVK